MATCPFCAEVLPEDMKRCPTCLRDLPLGAEDAYELPGDTADIPLEWQAGAVYALELPARCPHCREVIRTLRVLRLKRTQVTFTSTLPRGGRVIVCPECERIVSAELTAL
jgi:hypothetical protein